jgi:hypothetical protein
MTQRCAKIVVRLSLDPFLYGRGVGGQAIGFAPEEQASLPPDVALAYDAALKAPPRPAFEQRWTTWGAAYGASNTSNSDPVVGSSNNVTAQTFGGGGRGDAVQATVWFGATYVADAVVRPDCGLHDPTVKRS